METRRLGESDLEFTTIGLGTWAIGGGDWDYGWGPQEEKDGIDTVVAALDCGINWIDTAPVYGAGTSETTVGKGIAAAKAAGLPAPYVATKCGRINQPDGSVTGDLSKEGIFREVEDSLQRLGVDVIDLYQIHWPKPDTDIEAAWSALCELREQGKIRYAGVSNFDAQQLERVAAIGPVTSLQPPYSMITRNIESDILPYCESNNVGVICYSPMYKGLLTGAFDESRLNSLDASDHRCNDRNFQSPKLEGHLALVERLKPIAERNERSLAQLAIAWVLSHSAVTSAIVGARRPDQIKATAAAGDWKLSQEDLAEITALLG